MLIPVFIVILGWVLWLWFRKRMVSAHRTAILAASIPATLLAIVTIILTLLGISSKVMGVPIVDICASVSGGLAAAAWEPG